MVGGRRVYFANICGVVPPSVFGAACAGAVGPRVARDRVAGVRVIPGGNMVRSTASLQKGRFYEKSVPRARGRFARIA
jgi:hypothetical protein